MSIHYQDDKTTIHHGDCLEVLRTLPDESVHAVVTDPPYGLSNTTPEQVAQCLKEWATGNTTFVPAKRGGFMGKDWDSFVPPPAVWAECFRVLKPGGHLLAFAGSRTQDLMGMSVRMAGFEMRDSIAWLYGAGFPKSLDVGKAIDKARDEDKGPTRVVADYLLNGLKASPLTQREAEEHLGLGFNSLCNFIQPNRKSFGVPRWELWQDMKRVIGLGDDMDAEVWRLNGRKGTLGDNWQNAEVVGIKKGAMSGWNMDGTTKFVDREEKAPATPEAEQWSGWGTALKPAFEPVVVARKPLEGTVAANVLEHGTGALNIDGCRVEATDKAKFPEGYSKATGGTYSQDAYSKNWKSGADKNPSGRWPANVVLDESQAEALDVQSGNRPGFATQTDLTDARPGGSFLGTRTGTSRAGQVCERYNDSGGASRFFYVAKAPKRERPNVDGTAHPTVKPLSLMRWLVRLVTPPGGTVLDPFAGSGTTIEAALTEGFNSIGIELTDEYLPLIQYRIERSTETTMF